MGVLPQEASESRASVPERCQPDKVVLGEPLLINPDSYDRITKVSSSRMAYLQR